MDPYPANLRYFTLMPNMPLSINREEALSFLASVSSVKSLHMLHLYRQGAFWQRVGLVEVSDKESVFRLTSRQFLLRDSHSVKHQMISPDCILATEFGDLDLCMHLNFYSRENTSMTRIIDFFEQFGSLNIMSMKSKDGFHELTFRAAKDYSIRTHSTDLRFKVDEIFVEVHFPEEKLNYDYISHDTVLAKSLDISPLELSKPFVPCSEFFNPKPNSCKAEQSTVEVSVGECQYLIDSEDDCLSLSAEDEDINDYIRTPVYEDWNLSPFNHFSPHRVRSFMDDNPLLFMDSHRHASIGNLTQKGRSDLQKSSKTSKQQGLNNEPKHPGINQECASHQPKKSKPARKKKTNKETTHKEINTKPEKVQKNKKKSEGHVPTEHPIDGRALLNLIWSSPADYQDINARVMPEIHAKWRRFVEIKDEMRRQKYQEYLLTKRSNCLALETGENNLSNQVETTLLE